MGDSGDSSSASDCGSPQPKGRSTSKVFVWLKEKAKCTPRGNPWVLLNREGRVKDVTIQGNYSSAKMKELVKENFAGLAAVDLNRIRLYKSANRGSRIEKVFKGIPDAKELLRIYGRGRANSRRIYMVLHRPRNGGSNTNPQSTPRPGVSNPNHPSPSLQTNPNFDVASLHPSTSQSQLSPPPAQPNSNPPSTNQSQPSLPPAQPDSNPPSTNQSQPSLPSAQPNSNPPSTNHFQPSLPPAQPNSNPPLLSQQSTTHQNPSQSQTSVTNSVIQPETSSGATSAASGVVGLVDLTLPTSEYGVIALDEVSDNELDRNYLASNPVNVDPACHLTGIHQWQKAGIVREDQSSLGILNQNAQVPLNDMDRTQEVLSCEHVLMEAASTHEDILLPIFLTLTYEELCHQARSDRRSMVIVILKGDNIPDVIRILNILRRSNGNAYFWISKENSKSGREVKRKFGSTGSDLLIMAPTTSRPILIERFCGDNLRLAREEDVVDAMKRAADAVDAFTREWERLEQERSLKREQEISLQKAIENDKMKLIKKSSKKIREARQGRVTQPSLEGEKVTIVLCHSNGKEKRQFNKGAFFQEVYDWAGSNECLPLYFTIQRGREVVRHGDLLERTEVLHICERDEAEIESLLGSKVTFQGNVPDLQSDGELSSTLPDEDRDTGNKNEELLPVPGIVIAQAEEGQEVLVAKRQVNTEEEEKEEDEEEERKREHREEEEKEHTGSKLERKRKKKDRRTTAKRKKEKEDSC